MLKLHNVRAGYGGADIIKNITLEINQTMAIIGANGSGKSTLLKVLAGLLPYQGEITLNGTQLKKLKPHQRAKTIAMLSQMQPVYLPYTVYDTVMMGRYTHSKNLLGLPTSADKAMVEASLGAVNMLDESTTPITQLSGGQLQRVFLARTLAQDPQIILLDEPTNHLDLKYQIELLEYLTQWAAAGNRMVVGVLHDINHAMALSNYIVAIKNGQILAQGEGVITPKVLQDVYDVDVAGYMGKIARFWGTL